MQEALCQCKQLEYLSVRYPNAPSEVRDFSPTVQKLIRELPSLKVLRWRACDFEAFHPELDAVCMASSDSGLQLLEADMCEWRDYSPLPQSLRYLLLSNM